MKSGTPAATLVSTAHERQVLRSPTSLEGGDGPAGASVRRESQLVLMVVVAPVCQFQRMTCPLAST